MKRNEFALEFVQKYGQDLHPMHRQALLNLGKGIIQENLNKQEIRTYHNKLKSVMKLINKKTI